MSTERLFLAIALPATVRERLTALYEPVRGVIWTRPDQLHLTLRFLGDVEVSLEETLETALARVDVESFVLPVAGVGAFPPRGPARVIWIGVGHGHPRLHQLRQQIDDTLLAAGVALDVRFFQPHITLGRVKEEVPPGAVAQFFKRHQEFETAPIRAEAFRLYASTLHPSGAVHVLKREFPLRS